MTSDEAARSLALTRRQLLCGASAVSVLAWLPRLGHAAPMSFGLDAFLALSKEQVERSEVSKDMAAELLHAFSAAGKKDALAALAAGNEDLQLANTLVVCWYTGNSPDPDAPQALHYTDALIWDAMAYTKPAGYCGGAMGYWAEPPQP